MGCLFGVGINIGEIFFYLLQLKYFEIIVHRKFTCFWKSYYVTWKAKSISINKSPPTWYIEQHMFHQNWTIVWYNKVVNVPNVIFIDIARLLAVDYNNTLLNKVHINSILYDLVKFFIHIFQEEYNNYVLYL